MLSHNVDVRAPLSDDQARAFNAVLPIFDDDVEGVYAITGKAGSGKTRLLADLVREAKARDFRIIEPDFEKKPDGRRSLAILTPTNKASSVLRNRDVPATTLHRILYRPVYHEDFEAIGEWLVDGGTKPKTDIVGEDALDRARQFYSEHQSVPGAMAVIGVKGADFIKGWQKRDDPLDIGFVDESSMLDEQQSQDLRSIFKTLVLFGDPAQLAPVGFSKGMIFDTVAEDQSFNLNRIHRQEASNPILDIAHALADPDFDYADLVRMIGTAAEGDDRIVVAPRIDTEIMALSPVLVWRNATRKRLIAGFRRAYGIADGELRPGEPLICDGIELPAKHRNKRVDLEARGLIKGAQVSYLGPGRKTGFARLYVHGAKEPNVSVASIIQIEHPDQDEPSIISAARMGANFIHGAASTIHKAQGSQWRDVQIFAPDILAASRSGRTEAGIPLWKRLVYVALTRAEERIFWITDYRMSKPNEPLDTYGIRTSHQSELTLK